MERVMTKRLITERQLKDDKGVPYSRQHLAVLISNGEFPKPLKLSARRKAWLEEDIDRWIEERAAQDAA